MKFQAKCLLVLLTVNLFLTNAFGYKESFGNAVFQSVYDLNVSKICAEQLNVFSSSLQQGFNEDNMWAWKMVDATSKLQSGILEGNLADLGAFDECINILGNTSVGDIHGKYCLGSLITDVLPIRHDVSKNNKVIEDIEKRLLLLGRLGGNLGNEFQPELKWAACFPDGCSAQEIAQFYNNTMEQILGGVVGFEFDERLCQTEKEAHPELSKGAIITILVFSIILALMCLSTLYDLYVQHKKSEPAHIILIAFSVYTNGGKLFAINASNPDQLPCLNGLRVISMMWVVIGHEYTFFFFSIVSNALAILDWTESLHSMYIIGATVSVDTFFLLSGLLMVYGFMKAMSKGVQFNVPLYWLHRYLRLTPAFAAVVLMNATLSRYLGSGPIWPSSVSSILEKNCQNYWWSSLLYIQNYVNAQETCIAQSWYLSVDMQLFILSPLILIPLWKWKKFAIPGLCLLILISIAVPFGIAWEYNLSAVVNPKAMAGDLGTKYYLVTHTRAAPWLIGVLLGYYIFNVRQRKTPINMNKIVVLILWAASLSVLITCVYGGHSTLNNNEEYDKWGNVSHVTFIRPAWAIALSWLIFACVTGYGGPINWFLSFPAYQVLGRLSYSVYLLHANIIITRAISTRLPKYFSDIELMYTFWGSTMFSVALAVVWNLAFESPMITIEKVLFHTTDKSKSKPNPEVRIVEEKQLEKC